MTIGPTPHKGEVFGGLGLRWHKRAFFSMPSSRGSVYPHRPLLITPGALTKTPKMPTGPQTCWKSCATLPWRSWTFMSALKFRPLRGRSCAVPAGPIWEKQASQRAWSCKLGCDVWPVPNVKGQRHRLCLWQHLATLKGQKCEIDSFKWLDLKKSLAWGAATDCRPFVDSPDKMAYLCHLLTWHIVIFSRLPNPLRCAIYAEFHQQHRHLKSCQEPLMCHLGGGKFWGPPLFLVHLPP